MIPLDINIHTAGFATDRGKQGAEPHRLIFGSLAFGPDGFFQNHPQFGFSAPSVHGGPDAQRMIGLVRNIPDRNRRHAGLLGLRAL
ncbi:hypothetical protein P7L68_10555 [Tistrella mobilis]